MMRIVVYLEMRLWTHIKLIFTESLLRGFTGLQVSRRRMVKYGECLIKIGPSLLHP